MKRHNFMKATGIQKTRVRNKSINPLELTFEDLYDDISHDWQEKAMRLRVRRWRKIKHHLI